MEAALNAIPFTPAAYSATTLNVCNAVLDFTSIQHKAVPPAK